MSKPAGITALGAGVFRIDRADGTHTLAYAVVDGARTWVFASGETFVLDPLRAGRDPRSGSGGRGAQDDASLAAPMPATVTEIHVRAGQQVQAGDTLVTLEAMKMELAIRAPREATVTAINCRRGELVQPGTPLVDLE